MPGTDAPFGRYLQSVVGWLFRHEFQDVGTQGACVGLAPLGDLVGVVAVAVAVGVSVDLWITAGVNMGERWLCCEVPGGWCRDSCVGGPVC